MVGCGHDVINIKVCTCMQDCINLGTELQYWKGDVDMDLSYHY